jgi:hypothetical protein
VARCVRGEEGGVRDAQRRHSYDSLCSPQGDEFDDPYCYCDRRNALALTGPRTAAGRALLREFHRSYFSEPHEESECYWTETVLAIEAEAAPASGLDVERLARALDVLSDDGLEYDLMAPEEREDRDDAAARLFAALPAASPEPDGLDVEGVVQSEDIGPELSARWHICSNCKHTEANHRLDGTACYVRCLCHEYADSARLAAPEAAEGEK